MVSNSCKLLPSDNKLQQDGVCGKWWEQDFSLNTNTIPILPLLTASPGLDTTSSKSQPFPPPFYHGSEEWRWQWGEE